MKFGEYRFDSRIHVYNRRLSILEFRDTLRQEGRREEGGKEGKVRMGSKRYVVVVIEGNIDLCDSESDES